MLILKIEYHILNMRDCGEGRFKEIKSEPIVSAEGCSFFCFKEGNRLDERNMPEIRLQLRRKLRSSMGEVYQ